MTYPPHLRSISILLVEDEELALKSLAGVISRKYPHAVLHTAANGRNGLELFKLHTPEVVITDTNMPEMDGVKMAAEIRIIKPDTKFIAITGENDFGFEHCIVKPIVFHEMFRVIEQCLVEMERY